MAKRIILTVLIGILVAISAGEFFYIRSLHKRFDPYGVQAILVGDPVVLQLENGGEISCLKGLWIDNIYNFSTGVTCLSDYQDFRTWSGVAFRREEIKRYSISVEPRPAPSPYAAVDPLVQEFRDIRDIK